MRLQRGLRAEEHTRPGLDPHRLLQAVAGKHARPGADDDHVGGGANLKALSNPEWRFGVRVGDDGAAAPVAEDELETRAAADRPRVPPVVDLVRRSRPFVLARPNGRRRRSCFAQGV